MYVTKVVVNWRENGKTHLQGQNATFFLKLDTQIRWSSSSFGMRYA